MGGRQVVILPALTAAALLVLPGHLRPQPPVRLAVDWPRFLGRVDPTWEVLPRRWFDAPFLGNGMLDTLVRQAGDRRLRWDVG